MEEVSVVPDGSRGGAASKLAELRERRRQKRVTSPSPTPASVEIMEDRMNGISGEVNAFFVFHDQYTTKALEFAEIFKWQYLHVRD